MTNSNYFDYLNCFIKLQSILLGKKISDYFIMKIKLNDIVSFIKKDGD